MQLDDFRSFEVIRKPEAAAISHIHRATSSMLRREQELTDEFGLRNAYSRGNLPLLGTHKMIVATRNAHPGSSLREQPFGILSLLSEEISVEFLQPISVAVGEVEAEEEYRNQTGYQAVIFANVAASKSTDDIGQKYAAQRLQEVAGTPNIWANLARIPLLYGSVSLLDDAYAKDRLTVETKKALSTVRTISYSGALRPRQKKIA